MDPVPFVFDAATTDSSTIQTRSARHYPGIFRRSSSPKRRMGRRGSSSRGEKELESMERIKKEGIPVNEKTLSEMCGIASRTGADVSLFRYTDRKVSHFKFFQQITELFPGAVSTAAQTEAIADIIRSTDEEKK